MTSEVDRLKGLLTLWVNLAPVELRNERPGPNGKSLAELTREAFDGSPTRREAILFEISAHATLYENDTPPVSSWRRRDHIRHLASLLETDPTKVDLYRLGGRCVAWLEHLERENGT